MQEAFPEGRKQPTEKGGRPPEMAAARTGGKSVPPIYTYRWQKMSLLSLYGLRIQSITP